MIQAEFSDEEAGIMEEALRNYLSELNREIFTTDSLSFKNAEELTEKKSMVADLVGKMGRKAA